MRDLAATVLASDLPDAAKLEVLRLALTPPKHAGPSRPVLIGVRGMRTRPRTKLHETWRARRAESGMDQQRFAAALGISYGVLRALEGSYSGRSSPPCPETHADAERRYQAWLERATTPAR